MIFKCEAGIKEKGERTLCKVLLFIKESYYAVIYVTTIKLRYYCENDLKPVGSSAEIK